MNASHTTGTVTDTARVRRLREGALLPPQEDVLAREEPLRLELRGPPGARILASFLRTPGHERELIVGWLHAEGLLPARYRLEPHPENPDLWRLGTPRWRELWRAARPRAVGSACGLCGSGDIEDLLGRAPVLPPCPLPLPLLAALPERLRAAQPGFRASGGLHGAALFGADGALLCAFEDVGRHNAADKALGHARLQGLRGAALAMSSRLSFELVQKAALSGVPALVGVGSATTLAVAAARGLGLTLAGFARNGNLTVYSPLENPFPPMETLC